MTTCCAQIHLNDIGTAFRVTVKDEDCEVVNISGALTKNIIFTKPDNTTVHKPATLINNGISGVMEYTTVSGDINVAGIWQIQGYLDLLSGASMYTNISSFRVYENLT